MYRVRLLRKHVERFEIFIQDCRGILESEPAGDHRRVYATEIGCIDKIVAFVELRQARNLPVMSALDVLACDKHQVRRAVIGAEAGVFRYASAELGKNHHSDITGATDSFQIDHER